MYAAFVVLALLAVLQGWQARVLEQERSADAEIIELSGRQAVFTQRIGRLVALLSTQPSDRDALAEELARVVERARAEATQLERLIDDQGRSRSASLAEDSAPMSRWVASRAVLLTRAEALLVALDAGDGESVTATSAAVQREIARAEDAALSLVGERRSAALGRGEAQRRQIGAGVVLSLVVLAGLALVVVEPSARAVQRGVHKLAEQAAELERLALVAERTRNLVLLTDREDRITWANEAFTRMTGWSLDEARGRTPGEILHHPDADPQAVAALRDAIAAGRALRLEFLNRTRDGHDLWLDVDIQPLAGPEGTVSGFVSVSSDNTAQAAQRLRMQAILAAMPDGLVVQDTDGVIVDANRSAERLLALPREQILGRDSADPRWHLLRDDGSDYPGDEHPAMRTLASGEGLRGELLGLQLPDGLRRWLLVNTEPMRDAAGRVEGVMSCFVDITEQRRLQEQLRRLARTDALTGLPNRAVMIERVERALLARRGHAAYGFAVLFMDFDRFKQINDTLGHSAGDELLRQIARRLEAALRPGDAIARMDSTVHTAARIGGDEFVVLLERVGSDDEARQVAERLLETLSQPYPLGGQLVQSGVSIGIVTSAHAGETADAVLRDADTAMYEAKRAGRGRAVLFDASMHERVVRILEMENDLRRALREDELFVVYQPSIDLATGAMAGVEALVRWRHPQRGLVPPVQFVPVAEEAGLIEAVGEFVLRTACGQFARWRDELGAHAPRRVAVNLSRAQLQRAGLVALVREVLEAHHMQPAMLELEVTETLAAQDEAVQATLRALKEVGVQLALDDFGTGYSSLACLHQLPVDMVKIDRSFVAHAETIEYHRVLIEATIRVARTLGMATVAEGIETAGQAALMERLACDRGQGWLWGRPMTADELVAWVRQPLHAAG